MDPQVIIDPGTIHRTTAWCYFTPPESGIYVVFVRLSGDRCTMYMNGSFGNSNATSVDSSTEIVLTGSTNGTAGSQVSFTLQCNGDGTNSATGYLWAIQFYRLG